MPRTLSDDDVAAIAHRIAQISAQPTATAAMAPVGPPVVVVLAPESVDALARRIVELQQAAKEAAQPELVTTGEILTRTEAMAYVKRTSEGAFSAWCKTWRVRPHRRGRYSRTQLNAALSQEARKRA